MAELPTSVRYVKNGAGGKWWADAKASGRIHAGWSAVPAEAIRTLGSIAPIAVVAVVFRASSKRTSSPLC